MIKNIFYLFLFDLCGNIKAISITKLVVNYFQHLIWIFCVCQLSLTWYNTDRSQLMPQFDHDQLQLVYLTMEHCLARNLQHKTAQTTFVLFDESQYLLHTLHKSIFVF